MYVTSPTRRRDAAAATCPLCMGMLQDGIGGLDAASKLRMIDLSEVRLLCKMPGRTLAGWQARQEIFFAVPAPAASTRRGCLTLI